MASGISDFWETLKSKVPSEAPKFDKNSVKVHFLWKTEGQA